MAERGRRDKAGGGQMRTVPEVWPGDYLSDPSIRDMVSLNARRRWHFVQWMLGSHRRASVEASCAIKLPMRRMDGEWGKLEAGRPKRMLG